VANPFVAPIPVECQTPIRSIFAVATARSF
jgi:hypothetical protein